MKRISLLGSDLTPYAQLLAIPSQNTVVDVATSSSVADSLNRQHLYEIIVADLDTCEKSVVFSKYRQSKQHSALLMVLSSSNRIADKVDALESGAAYYFLKPHDLVMLEALMAHLLRNNLPGPSLWRHDDRSVEILLHEILGRLCVPRHARGYLYIHASIRYCLHSMGTPPSVTREVYPAVAHEFGTLPQRVERNIRTAIHAAWRQSPTEARVHYFGFAGEQSAPLTNKEFIVNIAYAVRRMDLDA